MSAGVKDDSGKQRYDLLPWRAVGLTVDVLTFGARKYCDQGWRTVAGAKTRYFGAALRHAVAHAMGQRIDDESGLPHLAHAICSLMFVLELDEEETA